MKQYAILDLLQGQVLGIHKNEVTAWRRVNRLINQFKPKGLRFTVWPYFKRHIMKGHV